MTKEQLLQMETELKQTIADYLEAKQEADEAAMDDLEIYFTDLLAGLITTQSSLADKYLEHLYTTFTYSKREALEFAKFYLEA